MRKYEIGYTQGVFDMFHVGHLNLLNTAKSYCDYLIVGVNSDDLTFSYKHKKPIISENDRKEIIENIKCVDKATIITTLNKIEILQIIKYNVVFIGDDWKENVRWKQTERELKNFGIDVIFLPYTKGVSSSNLSLKIRDCHEEPDPK
jgi:glycerol-3-phosphate cytidylyltransferase